MPKILIASLLSAKQSSQNSFFHIEILEGDFFTKKPATDNAPETHPNTNPVGDLA